MKRIEIKILSHFMILFLLYAIYGCATTMSDVIRSKKEGKGTSKIYPVNLEQCFEIARTVFRWEVGGVIEEHKSENYMLTSTPPSYWTEGILAGAWCEPVERNKTKVTVVTKRRDPMDPITSLTETTFHKRFEQCVKIIKEGKTLPLEAPE